jgi:hypothetical protein
MITYMYLTQTILGIFLWKRFKFSWGDSIIFSLMVLPNIILVSVKLFDFIFGAKKVETENDIKCTGNNGNGCFMDSCGINCHCESLREFGEKLKNKL